MRTVKWWIMDHLSTKMLFILMSVLEQCKIGDNWLLVSYQLSTWQLLYVTARWENTFVTMTGSQQYSSGLNVQRRKDQCKSRSASHFSACPLSTLSCFSRTCWTKLEEATWWRHHQHHRSALHSKASPTNRCISLHFWQLTREGRKTNVTEMSNPLSMLLFTQYPRQLC